jgi:hypothetical protein
VDEDNGNKHLTVALGVYPHEEPGIGPNKYNFDDDVLYQIHVALGSDLLTVMRPFHMSSGSRPDSKLKTLSFNPILGC